MGVAERDVSRIDDDEALDPSTEAPVAATDHFFRRVLHREQGPSVSYRFESGAWRVSQSAFADRSGEPSIDREARLLELAQTFAFTQGHSDNGVVRLRCSQIQSAYVPTKSPRNAVTSAHLPDVERRPLRRNPAHCVVVLRPHLNNRRLFSRLCERLALIATWEIKPADAR